jgi:hypothetical protein
MVLHRYAISQAEILIVVRHGNDGLALSLSLRRQRLVEKLAERRILVGRHSSSTGIG